MEGKPEWHDLPPASSAIDLLELPAIVAALTATVGAGVAAIADRVESYLEGRPEARDDPAPHGLTTLPGLFRDLETLGQDYARLTRALADLGPARVGPVDVSPVIRAALGPLAISPSLPPGPIVATTDPSRLESALSGFLQFFPDLADPGSGSTIQVDRLSPGWALSVTMPGRVGSPSDRSLLGELGFPMPVGMSGPLPEEEIELTMCREMLLQLGARLSCGIGRPAGVALRLEFPG